MTCTVHVHDKVHIRIGVKIVTISEFLEGRNVERQAVTRYINRHKEDFDGHTSKSGREIELDETAVRLLEAKYPIPAPVEIIVDHESRDKLLKAQEQIIYLQQTVCKLQNELLEAEKNKMLLEDTKTRLEASEAKIEELEGQLEAEQQKTWLQKLFKR